MRARGVLTAALLLAAMVGSAVGSGSGPAGAEASSRTGRNDAVTLTGVLEQLVVDHGSGEDVRNAVRASDQTWWLDGLTDPPPAAGTVIEVSGKQTDAYTLDVDTLRVATGPGQTETLASVSAATPSSTRALVIRVYWTASPPAKPTTATTRQRVLTDSQTWFGEVSHGRYTVSGTVTRWLKVSRPDDCYGSIFAVRDQALAAARRAGYKVGNYGRHVMYLPCSPGGILGVATTPGADVWLFNTVGKQVVVHEQGHNLGLPHASSRVCSLGGSEPVTWSSTCYLVEYGDEIDAMGNRLPGHYGSYYKSRLGWLQSSTTVTSTRTVTLAPYEKTGPGVKAIRVRAGGATYWLEYRTRTGADSVMPAGTAGVQIRLQSSSGQTQLLDAAPGTIVGGRDFVDSHLPAGSSWTTPEHVRIRVTGQTSAGATVEIRFAAGAPTPPAAPAPVRAEALVTAARITWTRPPDNGAIIRQYTITRSGDGHIRTVTTTGGLTNTYTWDFLDPNQTYTFSVRATNQAGTSPAATSPPVRPVSDQPSVAITSPAADATVQGIVPVEITATPSPATSPIQSADLYVDGTYVTGDQEAPWGPLEWDTGGVSNGAHTIEVIVTDFEGDTASASRSVTVSNPTPTVAITSPHDGDTVGGQVEVMYSLSPADANWQDVYLFVDGGYWTWAPAGDPLVLDTSAWGPGPHTVHVEAHRNFEAYDSPSISLDFAEP
jgi:hypothetical protein